MSIFSPDQRLRLLNTALERVGCTLQQAFLCHHLFNATLSGTPEQTLRTTPHALAARPTRLCCSPEEVKKVLARLHNLGFVRMVGPGLGGAHNAQLELQLDWEVIEQICQSPTPTA